MACYGLKWELFNIIYLQRNLLLSNALTGYLAQMFLDGSEMLRVKSMDYFKEI